MSFNWKYCKQTLKIFPKSTLPHLVPLFCSPKKGNKCGIMVRKRRVLLLAWLQKKKGFLYLFLCSCFCHLILSTWIKSILWLLFLKLFIRILLLSFSEMWERWWDCLLSDPTLVFLFRNSLALIFSRLYHTLLLVVASELALVVASQLAKLGVILGRILYNFFY